MFSRSELRRQIVAKSVVSGSSDPSRARVKKWAICPVCKLHTPAYQLQVDHVVPIIAIDETLDDLTWDELVNRLWCDEKNLVAICKPCHTTKTKGENKLRREYKKGNKKK